MGRLLTVSPRMPLATVSYIISERVSLEAGTSSVKWQGTFTVEGGAGGAFEKGQHPKLEGQPFLLKGQYVLELQDRRSGKIAITLLEKRAVVSSVYHFRGIGPLE